MEIVFLVVKEKFNFFGCYVIFLVAMQNFVARAI